ncbi:MAG: ATP-binding protein, partial [Nanoarchaeota archaeon]|nr:ATP-binding protein [Nanoarchaeota archaeon]
FTYIMMLVDLINKEVNTIIVGEFGVGKTHTLNRLAEMNNTRVLTSNPSLNELQLLAGKRFNSKKEAYECLLFEDRKVLLFDDLHESRKDTISMILRLCKKHTIICASEKEIERLRFDFKTVKIKPLTSEQSFKLCRSLLNNENVCNKICNESRGLPLLIIRGVEHYKVTGVVKKYFVKDLKIEIFKRLTTLAYLCLSVRYFARYYNNWELYSMLSSAAYGLLALSRFNKKL